MAFHWFEASPELGGTVPAELTVPLPPHRLAMAGTTGRPVRCIGLDGEIGFRVHCAIYTRRPAVCREFACAAEVTNPGCDQARRAWGLDPIEPSEPRRPPGDPQLPRAA